MILLSKSFGDRCSLAGTSRFCSWIYYMEWSYWDCEEV